MAKDETGNEPWVIGPHGERLTRDMLPKPGMSRWLIRLTRAQDYRELEARFPDLERPVSRRRH